MKVEDKREENQTETTLGDLDNGDTFQVKRSGECNDPNDSTYEDVWMKAEGHRMGVRMKNNYVRVINVVDNFRSDGFDEGWEVERVPSKLIVGEE